MVKEKRFFTELLGILKKERIYSLLNQSIAEM